MSPDVHSYWLIGHVIYMPFQFQALDMSPALTHFLVYGTCHKWLEFQRQTHACQVLSWVNVFVMPACICVQLHPEIIYTHKTIIVTKCTRETSMVKQEDKWIDIEGLGYSYSTNGTTIRTDSLHKVLTRNAQWHFKYCIGKNEHIPLDSNLLHAVPNLRRFAHYGLVRMR